MDRLTYIDHKGWYAEQDGIRHRGIIVDRLAAYENLSLMPYEVAAHEAMFKAYRHVCGGKSPEEVQQEISENARLRAELNKVTQERALGDFLIVERKIAPETVDESLLKIPQEIINRLDREIEKHYLCPRCRANREIEDQRTCWRCGKKLYGQNKV